MVFGAHREFVEKYHISFQPLCVSWGEPQYSWKMVRTLRSWNLLCINRLPHAGWKMVRTSHSWKFTARKWMVRASRSQKFTVRKWIAHKLFSRGYVWQKVEQEETRKAS